MEQLRVRFRERLVAERDVLAEALGAGDREQVRAVCHRMAGAAGMFGSPDLSALASELEALIEDGTQGEALSGAASALLAGIDIAIGARG